MKKILSLLLALALVLSLTGCHMQPSQKIPDGFADPTVMTDAPAESPTEAPAESPSEEATEPSTEKPTEESTEAPTEAPTEQPTVGASCSAI